MHSPSISLISHRISENMITADRIGFEFAGRWLYRDASMQIKPGDRIGLIGRNGTGKTTLLKLLTGSYSITEGTLSIPNGTRIGFLNQDLLSFHSDAPLIEVVKEAFDDLLELQTEIEQLLEVPLDQQDETWAIRLGEKQALFEARGGYDMDHKTSRVLAGLGFTEWDLTQPYGTFSGGWRMRAMLAKLLLGAPDLLLLDEPTNHLDLPTIEWLETYLKDFPGAIVVVSHDKTFLNRIVNKIVEIEHTRFTSYTGNYTHFEKEKAQRAELHRNSWENQQKQIAETERFINRFRAKATKAKQVQSKIKLLEKMERIEAPEDAAAVPDFKFKIKGQPGKQILEMDIKQKAYGDKVVLSQCHNWINRGDKIALIGANGIGKSTVLRILDEQETFDGTIKLGHNVNKTFFAQHQSEALDGKNNILEELDEFCREYGDTYVRNILGCFLFSGEDVEKKVSVLSGGEKSRVALAKALLSEANFLLLDEPTNHLDIQSIEILSQALRDYQGTFIVVSHNRHFLNSVANKIWYIEDQQVKEYPGTYAEYESSKNEKTGGPEKKVVEKKGYNSKKDRLSRRKGAKKQNQKSPKQSKEAGGTNCRGRNAAKRIAGKNAGSGECL